MHAEALNHHEGRKESFGEESKNQDRVKLK